MMPARESTGSDPQQSSGSTRSSPPEPDSPNASDAGHGEEPALHQANVLLVDDNDANLLALEAILEPLGQRLVKARSGEDALRRVLQEDFALILMDVKMPGLDGFETARLIKQRDRTRSVPIIFLTGYSREPGQVLQGYSQGAVDYLVKPFDPDVLRAKVNVFVDVHLRTERLNRQAARLHQKEKELLERANEQRFRTLLESIPMAAWVVDPDGQVRYRNRTASGYVRDRMMPGPHDDPGLFHRYDLPKVAAAWDRAQQEAAPLELQIRMRSRAESVYRWHLLRGVPDRDPASGRLGWIFAAAEIDDMKSNEQVLANFKATLDATQDCVFLLEPHELKVRYANQGALRHLGFSPEQLLGRRFTELLPPEVAAVLPERLEPLREDSSRSWSLITALAGAQGSTFAVEIVAQFVPNSEAESRFVFLARDITDRMRIERELRLANAVKDDFLAAASHELRTPLQAIKGYAHLAQKLAGAQEGSPLQKPLTVIQRQIDRMAKLVEDLLDVSRIQAGRLSLQLTTFDLAELLQEAVERLQIVSPEHPISTHAEPGLTLTADRARLDQVITNLVSNAIRYSPGGGPIAVEARRGQGVLVLSVGDKGVGIPKEKQGLVFERFGRAHGSAYGGLGLGLTISQGIVEQHGGRIWVESAGVAGLGTTVYVELPAPA